MSSSSDVGSSQFCLASSLGWLVVAFDLFFVPAGLYAFFVLYRVHKHHKGACG